MTINNRYTNEIISKAEAHIRQFLDCPSNGIKWWETVKSYVRVATSEYYERTLIELIQNGSDALARKKVIGRISILLDFGEGDFGTLYIANEGEPFTSSHFISINEPGVSDKKPGEGIGNKGIGFRSVLQVTDWPEIYSINPEGDYNKKFDGFCFGYAKKEDIFNYSKGNNKDAERIINELPHYLIPVPINKSSKILDRFVLDGYVSVIRLPLNSKKALDGITHQYESILTSSSPVMLFLPHVKSLNLKIIEGEKVVENITLTKNVLKLGIGSKQENLEFENVDLGKQGTFFVANKTVSLSLFKNSLKKSIEEKFLDEKWMLWNEPIVVSAAVRIDSDVQNPRCYTFLPMGENTKSPIHGHINAPFITSFARLDLNLEVPLNAYLFQELADLSLKSTRLVRESNIENRGIIVSDLICWNEDSFRYLMDAAEKDNINLESEPLFPTIKGEHGTWGTAKECYRVDDEKYIFFTPKYIAKVSNNYIIDPEIGITRIDRIDKFCQQLAGREIKPNFSIKSNWAELLAKDLRKNKLNVSGWDEYYQDLSEYFEHEAWSLDQKRILIDQNWKLQQAGRTKDKIKKRRSVFFSPVQVRTEDEEEIDASFDIKLPSQLAKHVSFMNDGLNWFEQDGGRRVKNIQRKFLENNSLVRRYRSQEILDEFSRVSSRTRSDRVRSEILCWVFQLIQAQKGGRQVDLKTIELFVPCNGGWFPSRSALFSQEWNTPEAKHLEKYIATGSLISQEVAKLKDRLVLSPIASPFNNLKIEQWRDFLSVIGVIDGLPVIEMMTERKKYQGNSLHPAIVGINLNLTDEVLSYWLNDINKLGKRVKHPYVDYEFITPFYTLPGLSEYDKFSDITKSAFARLCVSGLTKWSNRYFEVIIEDQGSARDDTFSWPTLIKSFMKNQSWLPQVFPDDRRVEKYSKINDSWYVPGEYIQIPRYSECLHHEIRKYFDDSSTALERYKNMGGHIWMDPRDSIYQISHLGNLMAGGYINDNHMTFFFQDYVDCWLNWLDIEQDRLPEDFTKQVNLVVRKGNKICCIDKKSDNQHEPIYVGIGRESYNSRMLQELDKPILALYRRRDITKQEVRQSELAQMLMDVYGIPFLDVSEIKIEIMSDNEIITPNNSHPYLIEEGLQWFEEVLLLAIESRSQQITNISERNLTMIRNRLNNIRLLRAGNISVRLDGNEIALPSFMKGCIEISHDDYPLIILQTTSNKPDWNELQVMSPYIARLVGYPTIAERLELVISKLRQGKSDYIVEAPEIEEIADALSLSVEEVVHLRESYFAQASIIYEMLLPVMVHYFGNTNIIKMERDKGENITDQYIISMLNNIKNKLKNTPEEIIHFCSKSPPKNELREYFGIDYADFNKALLALDQSPIINEQGQKEYFYNFISINKNKILESLRSKFLNNYREQKAVEEYKSLKSLSDLTPNPIWAREFYLPDENIIRRHIDNWLSDNGCPNAEWDNDKISNKVESRIKRNNTTLTEFVEKVNVVIPLWLRKHENENAVKEAITNISNLKEIIQDSCILEFVELHENDYIEWMVDRNLWPKSMPYSLEYKTLKISTDDINYYENELIRIKEQERKKKISIEIDGVQVSSEFDGAEKIEQLVRKGMKDSFLNSSTRFSKLEGSEIKRKKETSKKNRKPSQYRERMNAVKKYDIGLAGEISAYYWLEHQYEKYFTSDCWVSGYRNNILGGDQGDDSLGYDFKIPRTTDPLYFEVKSTVGDAESFELGETEIIYAQENSTKKEPYRILFIQNVLDSKERRISVLPNPFGPMGRNYYRVTGSGLRYVFKIRS